ncbi:thiol reductant ABC exporter subunit CydD [Salinisphaera sp. Q1T1-3]|uniref:thiol reductant ABC exporter subunit CydD n=1 Tax=Salinisphaera sp. Q1T1-3 TaxID=2321229 RepID=UPI000E75835B|nr:thiol reductant ABC exporter subunit CydD [Salinisphaera sp. Q1T1-3]RJS92961.1 thiol reductant ABC exporter subunit CydD [Salinisphaera sp. Q1T1-3]
MSATTAADAPGWLASQKSRVSGPVATTIGLGLAGGLLLIVQASLFALLANAVIFDNAGLARIAPWLIGIAALVLVRAGLVYAAQQSAFVAGRRIKTAIRARLIARLGTLGIVWQRATPTGDVVNTLTDGVEALEAYYARYLPQSALAALIPLSILVVVVPIDWLSALILVITAPLIPVFMVFIGRGAEKLNQRQWRRMGQLSGHFLDALSGLSTLRIFNLGRREARLIARFSEEYRLATLRVLRLAFVSSLVLEFLATVSIAMVAVLIGFRLLWGDLGFAAGFVVLLLAPEFYLPLRNMGSVYHARMEAIGAAEGIVVLLDEAESGPATAMPGTEQIGLAAGRAPYIELRDVGLCYPDGTPALRAIDLAITPGETVAIVGASGAGKSTLAGVLLGLLAPSTGQVWVDGIDRSQLDAGYWHRFCAWVPQQPRLFHGTVRDNLALADPAADDATLWHALERAQARDFVAALADGLDTAIGERGLSLSGGEIQRLAIARALVSQAPFVVVDEASAHLDRPNEVALTAALAELGAGRSLVVIAHRLATIRRADRIVVLDAGRIVEIGTHNRLRAAGGPYAAMLGEAPR